ncbi:hypothetical protein AB0302_09570 [Micrococcus sp. NPDC078436]|uniref:hypothetical protein n=1 Tax=unclassified Micrococcus TaxID=2620948 RepID=UPI0029A61D5E|nr:hypothetical protein [Micrococcus sp. M4NT]MDX2341774.1 hypothetical protein [Micrococcus sp. M4NT]
MSPSSVRRPSPAAAALAALGAMLALVILVSALLAFGAGSAVAPGEGPTSAAPSSTASP